VVESYDKSLGAGAVRQRVVLTVEVIYQSVDDGEVEQVEVETTLIVRLDRTSYLVTVRPVVESVPRPADRTSSSSSSSSSFSGAFARWQHWYHHHHHHPSSKLVKALLNRCSAAPYRELQK